MRLRTYNSRRKRLNCVKKDPVVRTFCYVVYGKRVIVPEYTTGQDGLRWLVNYRNELREWKRPFSTYGEAIAHLTRIKLAIDEEDHEWVAFTPCKIVEGYYTKPEKK